MKIVMLLLPSRKSALKEPNSNMVLSQIHSFLTHNNNCEQTEDNNNTMITEKDLRTPPKCRFSWQGKLFMDGFLTFWRFRVRKTSSNEYLIQRLLITLQNLCQVEKLRFDWNWIFYDQEVFLKPQIDFRRNFRSQFETIVKSDGKFIELKLSWNYWKLLEMVKIRVRAIILEASGRRFQRFSDEDLLKENLKFETDFFFLLHTFYCYREWF